MTNKGGFSWKTLLGITAQKRKMAKITGIPLTKTGIKSKLGSFVMNFFRLK